MFSTQAMFTKKLVTWYSMFLSPSDKLLFTYVMLNCIIRSGQLDQGEEYS